MFNNLRFRINLILAKQLMNLNEYKQASRNAKKALEIASIKEPQLKNHPTIGLVNAKQSEIADLKAIILKGKDSK